MSEEVKLSMVQAVTALLGSGGVGAIATKALALTCDVYVVITNLT